MTSTFSLLADTSSTSLTLIEAQSLSLVRAPYLSLIRSRGLSRDLPSSSILSYPMLSSNYSHITRSRDLSRDSSRDFPNSSILSYLQTTPLLKDHVTLISVGTWADSFSFSCFVYRQLVRRQAAISNLGLTNLALTILCRLCIHVRYKYYVHQS